MWIAFRSSQIAMLRQLGFPTGKQILIELIVGSKKIQTNMGSTNREQLGVLAVVYKSCTCSCFPAPQYPVLSPLTDVSSCELAHQWVIQHTRHWTLVV